MICEVEGEEEDAVERPGVERAGEIGGGDGFEGEERGSLTILGETGAS